MTDLVMPGSSPDGTSPGWSRPCTRVFRWFCVTGCAETIPPDQPERTWVDAILGEPCGLVEIEAVVGAADPGPCPRWGFPLGADHGTIVEYTDRKTPQNRYRRKSSPLPGPGLLLFEMEEIGCLR